MAKFPVNPRFGKMLIIAFQTASDIVESSLRLSSSSCSPSPRDKIARIMRSRTMQQALTLVSVLAERSPFLKLDAQRGKGGSNSDSSEDDDNDESDDEDRSREAAAREKKGAGSYMYCLIGV